MDDRGGLRLEAREIRKRYRFGGGSLEVLRSVDFEVSPGEIVGLVGASGAGKSTLLHVLGLLDPPTEGRVFLGGAEATALPSDRKARLRNRAIGFVFQFYHLLPDFDAVENVLLPRWIAGSRGDASASSRAERERACSILERVGLGERLRHRPSQLSGGERQRVAIARALFPNPAIVLCDEPTGNLDTRNGEAILDLLFEWNRREGTAFVIASHNPEVARRCARVVHLRDGLVVDGKGTPAAPVEGASRAPR